MSRPLSWAAAVLLAAGPRLAAQEVSTPAFRAGQTYELRAGSLDPLLGGSRSGFADHRLVSRAEFRRGAFSGELVHDFDVVHGGFLGSADHALAPGESPGGGWGWGDRLLFAGALEGHERLYRGSLSWDVPLAGLRLGRQRFELGHGMFFNAVDAVQRTLPWDDAWVAQGPASPGTRAGLGPPVDGAEARLAIADAVGRVYWVPKPGINDVDFVASLSEDGRWGSAPVSLGFLGGFVHEEPEVRLLTAAHRRYFLGSELTAGGFDVQAAYLNSNLSPDHFRWQVGWTGGAFTAEYYFNGGAFEAGTTPMDTVVAGDRDLLGRHYGALAVSSPWAWRGLVPQARALWNSSDGSWTLAPGLRWSGGGAKGGVEWQAAQGRGELGLRGSRVVAVVSLPLWSL